MLVSPTDEKGCSWEAAPSQILSRAGVWGNPVSPPPSLRAYVHVRRSCAWRRPPDAHGPGSRASRPRRGSAGTVTVPSLTLPRRGAGTWLLPSAGGGWEGSGTLRTMVTAALHAAPPHNAAMNIRLFLGGLRPPRPSHRVEGWGNRVSPCPHPREGLGGLRPPRNNLMFIAALCGRAAWTAAVTIVRRVQPPSQPPPAGGRSRVPSSSGGRVREGAVTLPAEPRRGRDARAPRPCSSGVVRHAHEIGRAHV